MGKLSGLWNYFKQYFEQKKWIAFVKVFLVDIILFICFALSFKNPLWSVVFVTFVVFNYILYSIVKESTAFEKAPDSLKDKDVKNAISILKIAVSGMAMLSWLTTAGGLSEFVFTDRVWKAYLASFGIQAILIVLSLMYCQLYVWMRNTKFFSKRFAKLLVLIMTALLTVSMLFSSSFSYVYIVQGIYEERRAKDENIILEQFLIEQSMLLQDQNEKNGEEYRKHLDEAIDDIVKLVTRQWEGTKNDRMNDIGNYLKNLKLVKYEKTIGDEVKFTEERKEQIYIDNNRRKRAELEGVFISFSEWYREYGEALDNYKNLFDELQSTKDSKEENSSVDIESIMKLNCKENAEALENIIEKLNEHKEKVEQYRGFIYDREMEGYKTPLITHMQDLASAAQSLKRAYEEMEGLLSEYQNADSNRDEYNMELGVIASVVIDNNTSLSDVDALIYSIKNGVSLIKEDEENGQVLDTVSLTNLSNILVYFEKYKEYLELKAGLEKFFQDNLGRTYIINGYGEVSANSSENIIYLTEEEWRNVRKEDFAEFIKLLKLLPDNSSPDEENESQQDNDKVSATVVLSKNDVLIKTYNINRDILENITVFEKSINYFKYDFNTMAYLAAFLALFFDLGSFAAGCLFFAIQSYRRAK